MRRKILGRAAISFMASVTVNQIVVLVLLLVRKQEFCPVVPEYASHFSSDMVAFVVQSLLMGVIGAVFAGSSVIFEIDRWSFLLQGVVHLFLTTAVWVPISSFCWLPNKYREARIVVIISFLCIYITIWLFRYLYYRKSVKQINEKIQQINQK